ncbi:MAG: tetratricopeptide repeat protein [Deltaproteobacteria bacterium]|nr:tetratricopeptide repeat protein [Deltaproteobacteria bacterium]
MPTHARLRAALLALLLVAMTVAAYGPALSAGFVWDDDDYVSENPLLAAPDGIARIWLSMDAPSQYVPMVYTTFRFEYGLWGLDPLGYHLSNVLLHAINALLLWWLLRRLEVGGAWLAAAIFALHPVNVESVAWIAERKNLLSLFFSLGSTLAWHRYLERSPQHAPYVYLLSLALYALALTSKATACTLPATLLILTWLRGDRIDRRRLAELTPFVLLGLAMGLLVMFWERFHIGTEGERFGMSLTDSFLVASRAVWFYLGKLVWPTGLTFSYPRFEVDPSNPAHYLPLLAGAVLIWILWRSREQIGRAPFAAALYFVANLAPMLGFIPLFTFWYTFVADHYQYVASIGPIALFAGGIAHAQRRWDVPWPWIVGGSVMLLLALGGSTFQQSRIYENRETLWQDTIAKNPRSWMAHTNLGRHRLAEERWAAAASAYEAALEVRPETYRAHIGLGRALARMNRADDARRHYEAALALKPDLPRIHEALAVLAWQRADGHVAILHYEAMTRLAPDSARAYFLLGRGLERMGRREEARWQYQRALRLDPSHRGASRALARDPMDSRLP